VRLIERHSVPQESSAPQTRGCPQHVHLGDQTRGRATRKFKHWLLAPPSPPPPNVMRNVFLFYRRALGRSPDDAPPFAWEINAERNVRRHASAIVPSRPPLWGSGASSLQSLPSDHPRVVRARPSKSPRIETSICRGVAGLSPTSVGCCLSASNRRFRSGGAALLGTAATPNLKFACLYRSPHPGPRACAAPMTDPHPPRLPTSHAIIVRVPPTNCGALSFFGPRGWAKLPPPLRLLSLFAN